MIKAVIFDFGKVILDIDFAHALTHWQCSPHHFFNDEVDEIHQQFERGQLSAADFYQAVKQSMGLSITEQEFFLGWNKILLDYVPGVMACIHKLKDQASIYLLSNTNAVHHQEFSKDEHLQVFHQLFFSHEIGHRKPDKSVYSWVQSNIAVAGEQILFLDDNEDNIRAARQFGWCAQKVDSLQQIEAVLCQYGLNSKPSNLLG